MAKITLTERIKGKAQQLGFQLVGVTGPEPPPHLDVYQNWLQAGHHGEMSYLACEEAIERRADPRQILPECLSILVLGIPYSNPASSQKPNGEGKAHGQIAAYAWGQDYHDVMSGY